MPKYWSVKMLLVTAPPSGRGVVLSLALDHAPFTMIVSLGTTVLGSGLRTLEKSPPLGWPVFASGWGAGWGAGGTGGLWADVPMICPQDNTEKNRTVTIRKTEHLDCMLLPPFCYAVLVYLEP